MQFVLHEKSMAIPSWLSNTASGRRASFLWANLTCGVTERSNRSNIENEVKRLEEIIVSNYTHYHCGNSNQHYVFSKTLLLTFWLAIAVRYKSACTKSHSNCNDISTQLQASYCFSKGKKNSAKVDYHAVDISSRTEMAKLHGDLYER